MSDISRIKLNGTEYTLKDPVARGEETETEGISHLTVDGTVYDCKDIVARGEGSANAKEISKVEVNGKTYQIKDEVARVPTYAEYFCVYSTDDDSLTFYGDNSVPDEGTQYGGKTATNVYTGAEDTGDIDPPWYSRHSSVQSVMIDASFRGARPTSCYSWFGDDSALTECDLSNLNTSNVTTMYRMFCNCSSLTAADVSNLNTSAVTTMYRAFYGCSSLTTLDVSNFDTSSMTNMSSMFSGCSSLTTLDVSNFDTSSVTTMYRMFRDCSELTTIYSDDAMFVTTAVEDGSQMFRGCEKLVGGNGTVYDSSRYDYDMAHVDRPDNEGYFTDIADKPD